MTHFLGNKGEWSELYVLLKLLSDRELALGGNSKANIASILLPIIEVIRNEQNGKNQYCYDSNNKNNIQISIAGKNKSFIVPIVEFTGNAKKLLKNILDGKVKGTFTVDDDLEIFLRKIGCTRVRENSKSKSDIYVKVHDSRSGFSPLLGFSVKSELAGAPTLLNASGATNFTFKIRNWDSSNTEKVNNIFSKRKKKDGTFAADVKGRIREILRLGGDLEFVKTDNRIFLGNLVLIDSKLPEILACLIKTYYSDSENRVALIDLIETVSTENPCNFIMDFNHQFYNYKIKKLLCESALGMRPAEIWHGTYDATGGYIVVKEDGNLVCYHIYNRNDFEEYLLINNKMETPSSEKHGFGKIYENNGGYFIKLNLQIRFIK